MPATLYLIATPIGNLEDITLRALGILRDEAIIIACEDTRQTRKLLEHYQIQKPLVSYHEHNEASRAAELLERLVHGESVALLSDAGTPLVSDPGYRLVAAAIKNGVAVVPVPGPSALLAALAASGLPANDFRFIGFLPSKQAARRKQLEQIAADPATAIAYESPHRILATLQDIAEILGDRKIVLARELTKIHEEFLRGTAAEILDRLAARGSVKGEITLVISLAAREPVAVSDPASEVARLDSEAGFNRMEAIKLVAKRTGLPKREIYRMAQQQGSNRGDKRRG